MLTGRLPDGREEIHMKKLTALLLALVMMLAAAAAEEVTQATLLFAYGDEAFDMHMREKANTIDYDGHTWLLEHDSFNYEGEFMMFGGNTRAVFEMDVPQFRIDEAPEGEVLKIGTVRITPPSKMNLLVFSGDHTTGQFTLVDSAKTDYYELCINAERDERGWLRRTDMVFLYSYNRGGRTVYYAATLYIGYENFESAPASLLPVHGVIEKPANLGGGYHSGSDAGRDAFADSEYAVQLQEENKALLQRVDELETQNAAKDAEITGLQAQIAEYERMVPAMTGDAQAMQTVIEEDAATIKALESEVAALRDENAALRDENIAQANRIAAMERELAFYKGSNGIGSVFVNQITNPTGETPVTQADPGNKPKGQ